MRFCPRCHFILDNRERDELQISVCRGCGGCWFAEGRLQSMLYSGSGALAQLTDDLPETKASEAYSGLSLNCPDCRIVHLEPAQAEPLAGTAVQACPKCGGAFLPADARRQLFGDTEEPHPETGPITPAAKREELESRPDYVQANEEYVSRFKIGELPRDPARKLAIVTCMDARMQVYEILGLKPGDANVIRNAGGIVTEDVLRSLIVSNHLLGTREVVIVNHTDCGLLAIQDDEFSDRLTAVSGVASVTPSTFHAFSDLDANVRRQTKRVRTHPWIPQDVSVRGFVYDVQTGRLREVSDT